MNRIDANVLILFELRKHNETETDSTAAWTAIRQRRIRVRPSRYHAAMPECPSPAALEAFHYGDLASDACEAIQRHLSDCTACRERIATLRRADDAVIADLRGIRAPASPVANAQTKPATVPTVPGYEILGEIHRGGQGIVYQAMQGGTRRHVALKILRDGALATPAARKRFEREVALAAQLKHPNIVTVFDSGLTADGQRFCAMDYIAGRPLNDHVRSRGLDLEAALRLFATICRGVEYAHERGIVHRDLKPSNILIDTAAGAVESAATGGVARIVDFGLAKSVHPSETTAVSLSGELFGTLPYLAPEQTSGNSECVDHRADIYSLGVVLFELLTGTFPYPVEGRLSAVLHHIAESPPQAPSRAWTPERGIPKRGTRRITPSRSHGPINTDLDTIVLRCLAKDPARRYATAGALADDLERYLAGEPIQARRDSRLYVLRKTLPRYKAAMALGAALVIAMVGVGVGLTLRARLIDQRRLAKEQLVQQIDDAIIVMDSGRLRRLLESPDAAVLSPDLRHAYQGWERLLRIDLDDARRHADRALQLNPDQALAYYLRGGLNAERQEMAAALMDLAEAQRCQRGTLLERGLHSMLKTLLNRHEEARREFDRMVAEHPGSGAALWCRGFSSWFQLLRAAPRNVDTRWRLANEALADVDAAARLYPTVPFVFDVRADLLARMTLLAEHRGDAQRAAELRERHAADGRHLISIGANGTGHVVLARVAISRDDFAEVRRLATMAVDELEKSEAGASVHREDSLQTARLMMLVSAWCLGDDDTAVALSRRVGDQATSEAVEFFSEFLGVVASSRGPRRAPVSANAMILKSYRPTAALGGWVGAAWTGDPDAARDLARRMSIPLTERLGWISTFLRFLRGEIDRETCLRRAPNGFAEQIVALCDAVQETDVAGRAEQLRHVVATTDELFVVLYSRALLTRLMLDASQRTAGDAATRPVEGPAPR